MRAPKNPALVANLNAQLTIFANVVPLLGINNQPARDCFLFQLEDSIRRIEYVQKIASRNHDPSCSNPNNNTFNPISAAAWHLANGNIDEASWIVFLLTHFGKNKFTGWQLIKDCYGGLGQQIWDWQTVIADPNAFGHWIDSNQAVINNRGKFGNHRKYESLSYHITGETINSYIDWIGQNNSHILKFAQVEPVNATPKTRFRAFYNSSSQIYRFGRMAKFDFLTMMGKVNILNIEPDSIYTAGATGPIPGAKILFTGNANGNLTNAQIENNLNQLDIHLALPFGMQVLEDALCNWQKSTTNYVHFRG